MEQFARADQEYLASYNPNDYEHPSVAVDVLIFTIGSNGKLEILLIKRNVSPFIGQWALPGGFVGISEDLDAAAKRVLEREVRIRGIYVEQLYTFGQVERDPRTRVISVAYFALVSKATIRLNPGTDTSDVLWAPINLIGDKLKVPPGIVFAFDHETIIRTAIERIRGKVNYTDLALALLGDRSKFTVFELQRIHEAILGQIVDSANFRRSFYNSYVKTGKAELTGEICTNAHGRPSKYYRLKKCELTSK